MQKLYSGRSALGRTPPNVTSTTAPTTRWRSPLSVGFYSYQRPCRPLSPRPHGKRPKLSANSLVPVHIPTWRPNISQPVSRQSLLRGLGNTSTCRCVPVLAQNQYFLLFSPGVQDFTETKSCALTDDIPGHLRSFAKLPQPGRLHLSLQIIQVVLLRELTHCLLLLLRPKVPCWVQLCRVIRHSPDCTHYEVIVPPSSLVGHFGSAS